MMWGWIALISAAGLVMVTVPLAIWDIRAERRARKRHISFIEARDYFEMAAERARRIALQVEAESVPVATAPVSTFAAPVTAPIELGEVIESPYRP